ncbi:hypothetical protein H634G_08896 [Metarhizium anisopliae BRIP 53293]|uniref:HMG box domain-containing protein n=1 Tax=Metarhizium anisopliae BRIP 53293 TaxID=1291518 RepID=A0A0D9NNB1_METAN|nr:hypothetical protein H634G_08896 [Metarhizium anisopliae BRIP 53293]
MLDTPVTFVTSEIQGNVHIFIPETFHRNLVEVIASNFRYKNSYFLLRFSILKKTAGECSSQYLCSMTPIDRSFESARFPQDSSGPKELKTQAKAAQPEDSSSHIPRPRNSWILYRQFKSRELRKDHPGITASELSTLISNLWKNESDDEKAFWQRMAQEEDRMHKEKYPGYKYTTKRNADRSK